MKGWECPKCGKGLAPWVKECDCVQVKQPIFPNYDPWPGHIRPHPVYPYPYTDKWYDTHRTVTCDTDRTTKVYK